MDKVAAPRRRDGSLQAGPETKGLGHRSLAEPFLPGEVGDRACDAQGTMHGSGGEAVPANPLFQEVFPGVRQAEHRRSESRQEIT